MSFQLYHYYKQLHNRYSAYVNYQQIKLVIKKRILITFDFLDKYFTSFYFIASFRKF